VEASGWFEVSGVAPGSYQIDVLDGAGRSVHSEPVWVRPGGAGVDLRIVIRVEGSRAGGLVSWKRLGHNPPKAARKEYENAMKELAKRKTADGIARLERAVAADPEFFDARWELGLALARQERAADALPHLEAAAAIDPGAVELHVTIAWALLALHRHADAERAAGEALQRDRSSESAHYLKGLARLGQNKLDAETLDHLERASGKFPKAREAAAWLKANRRSDMLPGKTRSKFMPPGGRKDREVENGLPNEQGGGRPK
jgi:tetratricopeptide (TPR) repeat protein